MAIGRPTELTEATEAKILEALRAGCTRRAACAYAGIGKTSFYEWLPKNPDFADAVARAEDEAESGYSFVIRKAAIGYPAVTVTETEKAEVKYKKTKLPDGTVIEEPVEFNLKTKTTVTEQLYDWRAAESWLKRRRQKDWGDKQQTEHSGELAPQRIIILDESPNEAAEAAMDELVSTAYEGEEDDE